VFIDIFCGIWKQEFRDIAISDVCPISFCNSVRVL
jgi:hypothetical protein